MYKATKVDAENHAHKIQSDDFVNQNEQVPIIQKSNIVSEVEAGNSRLRELNSNVEQQSEILPPKQPDLIQNETMRSDVKTDERTNGTRYNFASIDCGATVFGANKESKSTSNILNGSPDNYLLNPCSAIKFVEVELCEETLMDALVLSNQEFFSSSFKRFKVFSSQSNPNTIKAANAATIAQQNEWNLVGEFVAKNLRLKQYFNLEPPLFWAKYVRIEFESHYGTEFYCPLTELKVFGTSILEDVKDELMVDNTHISPDDSTSVPSIIISEISLESVETSVAASFEDVKVNSSNDLSLESLVLPTMKSTALPTVKLVKDTNAGLNKQESVLKNIVKRLNFLEKDFTGMKTSLEYLMRYVNGASNQTLDEQGRMSDRNLLEEIIQQQRELLAVYVNFVLF